ncbi:MAG: hypothetical protein HN509_17435, partial [Halobacteriovoraceae bacterium]|nr:hypothetical protein [Halobacteriovoraceae bacterium]
MGWLKCVSLCLILMLTACTNYKKGNRSIASDPNDLSDDVKKDRTQDEADAGYWKNRGAGWSKFKYDGYTGKKNKIKFIKTLASKKNRKFSFELSGRRQQLLEENLFDTGVSPNGALECDKIMKRVHRTPFGNCYFYGNEKDITDDDKNLVGMLRMGA